MLYKNVKTGRLLETNGEISAPDWERVKDSSPEKTEKPEAKKPAKEKR